MKILPGSLMMLGLVVLMGCKDSSSSSSLVTRVVLNEVCSANASVLIGDFDKNCTEWLEIANTGEVAVDITGYFLTDDPLVPDKWKIPSTPVIQPGETVLFWADKLGVHNHTNFKLKLGGGKLALNAPSKEAVDSVDYPAQITDVSYGRGAGGGEWFYCATPSPGKLNSGVMTKGAARCQAPVFSQSPGFLTQAASIAMTADPGVTIRYTLDGSIPSVASNVYNEPIFIESTKVLRARAFSSDAMPSLTTTASYFLGETHGLPVVSVSTDPGNLWDDLVGIYVKGPSAETEIPYYGSNFWQDWERAANIELFEKDGTLALSAFGGMKINGNTTVVIPEKSLAFYAKEKYGLKTFTCQLFPEKLSTNYPRILLRNSGQDWPLTLFRDSLTASVIKGQMDLDYQAYRPVRHFLNGEYNGIINLREKADQYFAVSNYGATAGKIDFLEHTGGQAEVSDGSDTHYKALISYLESNDPTLSETYAHVQTLMDVSEFMNYIIVETYCGNYDWPAHNVKLWRSQTEDGKWRWLLQDTDFCWGFKPEYNYNLDIIGQILDPNGTAWPNPAWSTFLFRSLIKNAEFRAEFLKRYQQHLDTTFMPARILGIIDAIQAELEPEMDRHIGKWGGQFDGFIGFYCFNSIDAWKVNIAVIRDYVQKRPDVVRQQLATHFPGGNL